MILEEWRDLNGEKYGKWTAVIYYKSSKSLTSNPEVFILNSGDIYIHIANSTTTTLTYHVTSACIHYRSLCFHLTLNILLPAILPSKYYKLKLTV